MKYANGKYVAIALLHKSSNAEAEPFGKEL